MSESVVLEVDESVATITVNRPETYNVIDRETLADLCEAVNDAKEANVRVLVLTGAGEEAFVAGADIASLRDLSPAAAHEYASLGHELVESIETYPGPAIAAINGYAFGNGAELALACDLRIASERAVIGQTEIDLGIIPGWGGTQRLPNLVGDETARRLIYFGDRVDASDAHELGLVGEVVAHDELMSHVRSVARELAEKPSFALAAAKEAINQRHQTGLSAGLDFERRVWSGLFGTHDQREGMAAFLEDREPDFE